jgi:hypothetical protein
MSVAARSLTRSSELPIAWPWLHSKPWDLFFIIGSCVLVSVPLLLHYQLSVSTTAINILVAALVGGPHMYSTYTFTMLEPSFWRRYPVRTLGALVVPVVVIALAITDLTLLLTGFLFWASLHVLQQIAWLADCYRAKAGIPFSAWSRVADYVVLFTSLYPVAAYKLVTGSFIIEDRPLPIPDVLRAEWVVTLVWAAFGAALAVWLGKTVWEARLGLLNGPKTLLIGLTVAISVVIPVFDNLDVSFQGMNTWHSFQYLALIWYVNRLRAERGDVTLGIIQRITGPARAGKFYGALVGVTLLAGVLVGLLYAVTGLTLEQCYFIVVLSFLLTHYYFDTFLFTRGDALFKGTV